MSKAKLLLLIGVVTGLLFSTASAFADSNGGNGVKPRKTPGAQATAAAIKRATKNSNNSGAKVKKSPKENFAGIIVTAGDDNLTIELADGSQLTFAVTDKTHIHMKGFKGAGPADIPVGSRVLVQARERVALRIHVARGKPRKIHRVGIVTAYSPGSSITIQAKNGKVYTFAITEKTKFLPHRRAGLVDIGVKVTIICPRDVNGGTPTAAGIVVHPLPPRHTTSTGTPQPTETPAATETMTATATPEAETTATATATEIPEAETTATETPTEY